MEIGGGRLDRPGLFFAPTILSNVDDDNYVAIEESFGPVMVVSDFDERFVPCVFIILVSRGTLEIKDQFLTVAGRSSSPYCLGKSRQRPSTGPKGRAG